MRQDDYVSPPKDFRDASAVECRIRAQRILEMAESNLSHLPAKITIEQAIASAHAGASIARGWAILAGKVQFVEGFDFHDMIPRSED